MLYFAASLVACGAIQYDVSLQTLDHSTKFTCEVPVWWLHIPKCGSSLSKTVSVCPTDEARGCYRNPHHPLPIHLPLDSHNVVAMFRKPTQRLASAYAFAYDEPFCMGGWGARPAQGAKVHELLKEGHTASSDKYLGESFLGCQTNMVMGRTCMAGTPADPEQYANEAIARVDDFKFAGLLESWGLSICLLNYKLTGRRFIQAKQLENDRPTPRKNGAEEYNVQGYPKDVADEMLYAHVAKGFMGELQQHDISKQTCSFDEEGNPLDSDVAAEFFEPGNMFFSDSHT